MQRECAPLAENRGFENLVNQTDGQRGARVHLAAKPKRRASGGGSPCLEDRLNDARQRCEIALREAQPRVFRRDDDIRAGRQSNAAAHGEALHQRDGLRLALQQALIDRGEQFQMTTRARLIGIAPTLVKVEPGAK